MFISSVSCDIIEELTAVKFVKVLQSPVSCLAVLLAATYSHKIKVLQSSVSCLAVKSSVTINASLIAEL